MSQLNADQVVDLVFGESGGSTSAVDHVFIVMEATYGPAWTRSMGAAPLATIKTVWGYQLDHFTHSQKAKKSILWALKNLPDTPPSAIAFRNLCRLAPSTEPLALPSPKADPAIVKVIVDGIKAQPTSNPHGMKSWAYRLRAMEAGGHKLSSYQKLCVDSAIGEAA